MDETQTQETSAKALVSSAVASMGSLYADSGGDVNCCELCDEPLDTTEPWIRGMDGAGAHKSCLRRRGIRV